MIFSVRVKHRLRYKKIVIKQLTAEISEATIWEGADFVAPPVCMVQIGAQVTVK